MPNRNRMPIIANRPRRERAVFSFIVSQLQLIVAQACFFIGHHNVWGEANCDRLVWQLYRL